ncbi:MAG: hypothetical protein KJ574_04360, partial [Nanoarchaeota archaeon]|nr:hypothetical protein [Nanoarchaeota archaeon]
MYNKILITGAPRSGKTTLIEKVAAEIDKKRGFVTREALDEDGERTGFDVISDEGNIATLASIHIMTPYVVPTAHNKKAKAYYIDVPGFEACLERLFHFSPEDILYLDEIGQMELFSLRFRELVESYLAAPNLFIGTISGMYYDRFTGAIRQ